jgi:hypothetical protein
MPLDTLTCTVKKLFGNHITLYKQLSGQDQRELSDGPREVTLARVTW